jgi:hypothetical protein
VPGDGGGGGDVEGAGIRDKMNDFKGAINTGIDNTLSKWGGRVGGAVGTVTGGLGNIGIGTAVTSVITGGLEAVGATGAAGAVSTASSAIGTALLGAAAAVPGGFLIPIIVGGVVVGFIGYEVGKEIGHKLSDKLSI